MTTLNFSRFQTVADAVTYYSTELDAFAGTVRLRFAFSPAIDEEYQLTGQQAQAYVNAGYAGTPGDTVQAWADATGATAGWAADDILATRSVYLSALESVRRIRLVAKADMGNALTTRDVVALYDAAYAQLDAISPPP